MERTNDIELEILTRDAGSGGQGSFVEVPLNSSGEGSPHVGASSFVQNQNKTVHNHHQKDHDQKDNEQHKGFFKSGLRNIKTKFQNIGKSSKTMIQTANRSFKNICKNVGTVIFDILINVLLGGLLIITVIGYAAKSVTEMVVSAAKMLKDARTKTLIPNIIMSVGLGIQTIGYVFLIHKFKNNSAIVYTTSAINMALAGGIGWFFGDKPLSKGYILIVTSLACGFITQRAGAPDLAITPSNASCQWRLHCNNGTASHLYS